MNEYSFTKKKFVTFSISCVTIQIFQEQEFQVSALEQTCLSEPEHTLALDFSLHLAAGLNTSNS
jgi:hypothetical protein